LEAFQGHPSIGERHSGISKMSSREQATAAQTATEETTASLAEWNARYKQRFGHIFLTCARGRTTEEILQELQTRYVYIYNI
jgi:5-hydroxyisourate hydrolase / 2-oxo-4-hydroxy-4-carboxy-5-ureidoimidazoline decarboxylase